MWIDVVCIGMYLFICSIFLDCTYICLFLLSHSVGPTCVQYAECWFIACRCDKCVSMHWNICICCIFWCIHCLLVSLKHGRKMTRTWGRRALRKLNSWKVWTYVCAAKVYWVRQNRKWVGYRKAMKATLIDRLLRLQDMWMEHFFKASQVSKRRQLQVAVQQIVRPCLAMDSLHSIGIWNRCRHRARKKARIDFYKRHRKHDR